jgi:ATP-dependent DNA helicase RecG
VLGLVSVKIIPDNGLVKNKHLPFHLSILGLYLRFMSLLSTAIEYLKGVGPAKADLLKSELGIFRFADLLKLYPYRYVDRSQFHKIAELNSSLSEIQIVGKITALNEVAGKGKSKRLSAVFKDETGSVELIWFTGAAWMIKSLKLQTPYVLYGKPSFFNGTFSFAHPELETTEDFKKSPTKGLQPLYPSSEKLNRKGLNNKTLARLTRSLIPQLKGHLPDFFPPHFLERYALMSREEALLLIAWRKQRLHEID